MTLDESILDYSLRLARHEGRVDEYTRMLKQICDEADRIKREWDALDYTPGEYTVDGRTCNFPLETQHEPGA